MNDKWEWDQKLHRYVCGGYVHVNDDGTRLVADAYSRAIDKTTYYIGRGYWKAAERWASVAWSLAESLNEVGWRPIDREDA